MLLRLFVGSLSLALLLFVITQPAGPAAAQTNISGFWKLTLSHPDIIGTILCTAAIDQQGSALDVSMVCDSLGSGPHTGSIAKATGAFTMTGTLGGQSTSFSGTAASAGSSMSGSWTISPIPATGSFSGTRNREVGGLSELPASTSSSIRVSSVALSASAAASALAAAMLLAPVLLLRRRKA